ncbi:MAG: response regulator [Deltaproteobacteria bacterium]|nr:response regulator [Deltaproteobacteria bacterium]
MEETILFVDDEQNVLNSLVRLFRGEGFRVLTADRGVAGLELVKNNRVSVVISDHMMPGMDGVKLLSLVKEVSPETVRCLLTAYADLKSSMAAINEGEVYRYIMKPWDPDDLRHIVREAVQRYRQATDNKMINQAAMRQNAELTDMVFRDVLKEDREGNDSKNILVADDSVFFRTKLSDILAEAGHMVGFASDGKEVISNLTLNAGSIDLVILDLQMPDIDGFGVLQWMNDNGLNGKPPVLVTTGAYDAGNLLVRLRSLGATGLLSKGFTPEQVIFRINRILFPEKVAKINKWKRVPVSIPVDFTDGHQSRTGFFLNISETGAFLYTMAELSAGLRLVLKFVLPGIGKVFEIIGNVKWATGEVHGKALFCGYGIVFNAIFHTDRQILREFISDEAVKIETDNYQ